MLNLGDAEILTKYTTKTTFIFHVTSYQMSICLLFEDRDTITIEEIKALLNMTDNEIYASLQNICTTKLPIFSRENGAEVISLCIFNGKLVIYFFARHILT